MHSATKYFAGHSDALGGTLSVKTDEEWKQLWHVRTYTGSNLGGLEAWLTLRSLRTLDLVRRTLTSRSLAMTLTPFAYWCPSVSIDNQLLQLLSHFGSIRSLAPRLEAALMARQVSLRP